MPNQGRFPHNLSNGRNSARSHVRFHTSSSRICGAITQCLQIKGWLDLWWKLLWRHHALILISFVWLQLTTFLLRLALAFKWSGISEYDQLLREILWSICVWSSDDICILSQSFQDWKLNITISLCSSVTTHLNTDPDQAWLVSAFLLPLDS